MDLSSPGIQIIKCCCTYHTVQPPPWHIAAQSVHQFPCQPLLVHCLRTWTLILYSYLTKACEQTLLQPCICYNQPFTVKYTLCKYSYVSMSFIIISPITTWLMVKGAISMIVWSYPHTRFHFMVLSWRSPILSCYYQSTMIRLK